MPDQDIICVVKFFFLLLLCGKIRLEKFVPITNISCQSHRKPLNKTAGHHCPDLLPGQVLSLQHAHGEERGKFSLRGLYHQR